MPSPVKKWAQAYGVKVLDPGQLKDPTLLSSIRELDPDLTVVVAYGRILPPALLYLPPLGSINVHASLLPQYRGAAPIQRAIMAGDQITGITIMEMDEGMDTGPILLQVPHPILPSDEAGRLHDRLALVGAQALGRALEELASGRLHPKDQVHSKATYAPPIRKEEGLIHWGRSTAELHNLIRALSPQPGAYTFHNGTRIKILRAAPGEDEISLPPPGAILGFEEEAIRASTGSGSILLHELQSEGRRRMKASEFARGHRLRVEDFFGGNAGNG